MEAPRIGTNFPIYKADLVGCRRDSYNQLWGWPWVCALNFRLPCLEGGDVQPTKVIQKTHSRVKRQESTSPDSQSCKTSYKSNAQIPSVHHKEFISWAARVVGVTALEGTELLLFGIQYSYLFHIPDLFQLGRVFPRSLFFLWPSASSVISISYLAVEGAMASAACTVPSPHISCQAPSGNPMGFAILQHQLSDHSVMNLLQHFLP